MKNKETQSEREKKKKLPTVKSEGERVGETERGERLMPKNRNQFRRRNGNTGRSERRSKKGAKQKSDRSDNRKTSIQILLHI